ncbi:MAG TPA: hypothetical protein VJ578_06435 [Dehalococcoidia bacterium]|nr:hypothetical protein [Dehalococcoidia bacterium]
MGQLRLLGEPPANDDHAALVNLAFPQAGHTGFVAADGLAGGQTVIGGTAAGENLSLQSTAHAARGVVQVIDALRIAGGLIQDSGGSARIGLAAASPHITLTGDLQIAAAAGQTLGRAAVAPAVPTAGVQLELGGALGTQSGTLKLLDLNPNASVAAGQTLSLMAIAGIANAGPAAGATAYLYGLNFIAAAYGQGLIPELYALWCRLTSALGSTVAITKAATLYARSPSFFGTKPADCYGLYVEPHGATGMTNAVGALIDAPAGGTNRYTIWAGAPITGLPSLRLDVGTPAAGQTLLWLAEGTGPVLRQVQWVDPGAGGANLVAGQRVMVLV